MQQIYVHRHCFENLSGFHFKSSISTFNFKSSTCVVKNKKHVQLSMPTMDGPTNVHLLIQLFNVDLKSKCSTLLT